MAEAEFTFDRPIPGQSLTAELGGRPWQTPYQYTTVEEALEYYIPRMANEEVEDQIVDVLEMGVPVTTLANTMQLGSVMEGQHSVDVGMLALPVLVEMIMFIADEAGIEYDSGMEDTDKKENAMVDKALMRLREESEKDNDDEGQDEVTEEIVETLKEDAIENTTGLMGRRGQ